MFVGSRRIGFQSYHNVDLKSNSRAWWIGRSAGDVSFRRPRAAIVLASSKGLLDPPMPVSFETFRQKSPFRRAPTLRLLRPRSRSPASSPSKAAQDRHENRFGTGRAAHATEQNISVMLRLPRQSVGLSSCPGSTIEVVPAGFPGLRAASPV